MWSEGVRGATAFLMCGGISETATACFCHRNTVLKRLHRFEDMTSLDLRNPKDLALAVLLTHYFGLMGET